MPRISFDKAQASAAVRAGGVLSAIVRAAKGSFFVELETSSGVVELVKKNDRQPRAFRDPGQALKLVRELGVSHGRLALDEWDTHAPKAKAWARPDQSAHLKAKHRRADEAAEYDKWYRAEVEQGLKEADDPAVEKIPHAQAMAMLTQMREARRKTAGAKTALRAPDAPKRAAHKSAPRRAASTAKPAAKRTTAK
jgi:hypothetical protein